MNTDVHALQMRMTTSPPCPPLITRVLPLLLLLFRCGSFHTVMAYSCSSGGRSSTRIAFMSNPYINRPGTSTPIGSLTSGYCAKRVSETAKAAGDVKAEVSPPASGSIRSALSATKCVDAVNYASGTQASLDGACSQACMHLLSAAGVTGCIPWGG
jgi:hypothetical protein